MQQRDRWGCRIPNPAPPRTRLAWASAQHLNGLCATLSFAAGLFLSFHGNGSMHAHMPRVSYGSTAYIPLPRRAQTLTSLSRSLHSALSLSSPQQRQSPTLHPSDDQTTTAAAAAALSLQPGGTTQCNAYAAHRNPPYRRHVCATWGLRLGNSG